MTWFIDGGAHRGESIKLARQLYDSPLSIIAVEPACECLDDLACQGVLIIPAALSTSPGRATLYRGDHEVSATLIVEKTTGGVSRDRAETVPTVTLHSILDALHSDDVVHLKLDIEGAEYDVLEQAIEIGSLRRVTNLYVDFHADRIPHLRDRHNALVEHLLSAGYPLPKWSPGENSVYPWGRKWLLS